MKAVLLPLQVACLLGLAACAGLPADSQLLEDFRQHRNELQTLVRMFEEDKGWPALGTASLGPKIRAGVHLPERISEYRRLCKAQTATDCIEGYDATFDRLYGPVSAGRGETKNPIWIRMRSTGLAISGSSKGFVYSANPTFEMVANLDQLSPHHSGTWIRHIEGPWYIYFGYED